MADWTPPSQMLARRPDCRDIWAAAIDNPPARADVFGSTLYRIHGSNEPETIGQVSTMLPHDNDDVTDLYSRVGRHTVIVKN